MDIQAMQSMDWLFKKERIYLLAQFWQQRATLAEKEVSALKEQLATANQNLQLVESKGGGGNKPLGGGGGDMEQNTMDIISRSGLEVELAAKEKEISQLVEDVQRLQASITKLQETSAGQIARLEEQLDHKRQHIARLEARLDAQRDYDDVKRELSLLRSIEFPSIGPGGPSGETSKSLEMLLLERTKALQQAETAALKAAADLQDTQQPSPATPNSTHQQPSSADSNKPEGSTSPHNRPPSSATPSFNCTSSPTSLSLVNTTTAISSPSAATTTTATTLSSAGDNGAALHHHLMNGNPKTPPEDASSTASTASALCNNSSHLLSSVNSCNNNVIPPPPTSTPVSVAAGLSFFRNDDSMKSPFRFDDPRSPFRFSEDGGPMTPSGVMVGRLGESLIPKGDPMEARLQEMLRYNMDKYSTQNLDTLHISRRVRELLSINNIGQRLFAKYVLGLSQGTVSELLSKPKPWDKLTEKGRDSYRKMHAWACDENAVLLLKSLIPKKGKDTGIPAFARGDTDNMTEERIAHILSEASQMMKTQVEDSHSNDSKSPNQGQCPSPLGKDSSQNRRLKKYENDDIPQEKVVRIYQEELAKLMGRRMDDSMRGPREHFPSLLFPHFFSAGGGGGSGPMDRTQEEIRMALDAYHRELAKLNSVSSCPTVGSPAGLPGLPGLLALQQQALSQQHHHAQLNGVAQDLSLPKDRKDSGKLPNGGANELLMEGVDCKKETSMMESVADVLRHAGSAFSLVRPKTEPGVVPGSGSQHQQPTTGSSASSPLSNSILPPAMTPGDDFSSGAAAASPLQRMASITNSLISQPSTPTHHSPSQRPLKAVLPPITQQQFDMFNNLNTEDIVKKVKESLSQYSISQRLFGESILGLSQGSVSDLLARPKPWHMLTQKGREPFIRMKMFLEDDNAVHKLVASQYKIAPEKLMRTGCYAGGPPCSSLGKPQPPSSKHSDAVCNKNLPGDNQGSILPPSLQLIPPHPQQPPSVPQPPPPPLMVTPPGHHSIGSLSSSELKKSQQNQQSSHPNLHTSHHHHQQQSSALRALQQHMTPSVYEMAALTQDLDTQVITTKIKEALLANNIGQKIFGEAVLGLSQGSVSELLSKPKPWHMLSIKGREPFIRMQLWLSDAHNVDRLQALKNERREANKRRRSSGPGGGHGGGGGGGSGGGGGADNSSDTSSNDTSEFYHSPSPGPGPPSAKKQRVLFSEEQKEALRLAFALDSYPNVATIEFLSSELALSSRTITNWFHNHRMRLKQQVPHGLVPDGAGILPPPRSNDTSNGGQQSFDPVQFRLLLNQRLLELQKERMGLGSVPLPYPPYFATNANLAALIGRGLLPTPDCDPKEQFSGLDLSMGGLKREPADYEDEEDVESNMGSEDSNLSATSLRETTNSAAVKKESSVVPPTTGRSSRRKPAAPQWVNPEWQEAVVTETGKDKPAGSRGEKEVIINGVCVMQATAADDYGMKLSATDEETVRVEPTPVLDPYEDRCSDASSDAVPVEEQRTQRTPTEHDEERGSAKSELSSPQNEEEEEERLEEGEEAEEEADGEVTEVEGSVEVRHKFIKQEDEDEEGRVSPSEEERKEGEWDRASGKRPLPERDTVIDKRIKAEDREERWEY